MSEQPDQPNADPNFNRQALLGFLLLLIMVIGKALVEHRP